MRFREKLRNNFETVSGFHESQVRIRNTFALSRNMASQSPTMRSSWSAETLLSAIKSMDQDAQTDLIRSIHEQLPEDPAELEQVLQAMGFQKICQKIQHAS